MIPCNQEGRLDAIENQINDEHTEIEVLKTVNNIQFNRLFSDIDHIKNKMNNLLYIAISTTLGFVIGLILLIIELIK